MGWRHSDGYRSVKKILKINQIVLITNDDIIFDKFYLENAINILKNTERSFLIASYKK